MKKFLLWGTAAAVAGYLAWAFWMAAKTVNSLVEAKQKAGWRDPEDDEEVD